MFYVCLRFVLIRIYWAPWKLLFVFGEGSVCLSKFLVTVEVSVVVERMREEDKRERLERQYLLFTQPLFHPAPPPPFSTRAIKSTKTPLISLESVLRACGAL
jgi:hypothetical protein